jgi:hypothetical protein
MTATPPATDRPMIEPVLKAPPPESDWGGADCVGWEEEVEEEGPTTVKTVVTKVPSTEVTTGDVTAAMLEVVDTISEEEVDVVEEVPGVEDEREVVADVEDGEDEVADKVDVGVLDVDGVVEVVSVF